MEIPFVDLAAQYERLQPDIDDAMQEVIDDTAFVRGPYVNEFEEAYAEAYGVEHCISVANGTDAIYVVLRMLGIGPGDEVITVANSWISSSETIGQTGATPVFVDIEPDYYNINVDRIESIATALDAGYRLFDSAELYGNESRIGDLLDSPGTPDREGLFLLSKVWNTNHEHVAEACEGTLAELGIDALDAYLLHWPEAWAYQGPLSDLASLPPAEQEALTFPTDADGAPETADVSLTETWERMEDLYDRGLTRSLGVCNVSLAQLETIAESARVLPSIVQVESHPYRPRTDLVEACHARGIRVLAHSPLSAPGLLDEPVLVDIADEHGVSPAAVAVAYHVDRGVVPIPASNDSDHVAANLAAARLRLTDADRDRLATLEDPEFER